jgi:hypothetical protein
MITNEIDFTSDIIDVREMIDRYEELESDSNFAEEFEIIHAILEDLKGYGGDEQWKGEWYPSHLIRYSYFSDYAREMLEDCGLLPRDLPHYIAIDWIATAENILVDYSPFDVHGALYYYR